MRINVKKTKVMRMPGRNNWQKVDNSGHRTSGKKLESVTLGRMVTEDCRSECEVRRRVALAKEAFNKKKDFICGSISL